MIEILLVEDVAAEAYLFRMALRSIATRHNITIASDVDEAADFLFKRGAYHDSPDPDLILLDLNLQGKSGLELLREVRADSRLKRVPTIILTSSTSMKDVDRAYDLGANMYLHKPSTREGVQELVNVIAKTWLTVALLPHANGR